MISNVAQMSTSIDNMQCPQPVSRSCVCRRANGSDNGCLPATLGGAGSGVTQYTNSDAGIGECVGHLVRTCQPRAVIPGMHQRRPRAWSMPFILCMPLLLQPVVTMEQRLPPSLCPKFLLLFAARCDDGNGNGILSSAAPGRTKLLLFITDGVGAAAALKCTVNNRLIVVGTLRCCWDAAARSRTASSKARYQMRAPQPAPSASLASPTPSMTAGMAVAITTATGWPAPVTHFARSTPTGITPSQSVPRRRLAGGVSAFTHGPRPHVDTHHTINADTFYTSWS